RFAASLRFAKRKRRGCRRTERRSAAHVTDRTLAASQVLFAPGAGPAGLRGCAVAVLARGYLGTGERDGPCRAGQYRSLPHAAGDAGHLPAETVRCRGRGQERWLRGLP